MRATTRVIRPGCRVRMHIPELRRGTHLLRYGLHYVESVAADGKVKLLGLEGTYHQHIFTIVRKAGASS